MGGIGLEPVTPSLSSGRRSGRSPRLFGSDCPLVAAGGRVRPAPARILITARVGPTYDREDAPSCRRGACLSPLISEARRGPLSRSCRLGRGRRCANPRPPSVVVCERPSPCGTLDVRSHGGGGVPKGGIAGLLLPPLRLRAPPQPLGGLRKAPPRPVRASPGWSPAYLCLTKGDPDEEDLVDDFNRRCGDARGGRLHGVRNPTLPRPTLALTTAAITRRRRTTVVRGQRVLGWLVPVEKRTRSGEPHCGAADCSSVHMPERADPRACEATYTNIVLTDTTNNVADASRCFFPDLPNLCTA
jgi:hypothetical protein